MYARSYVVALAVATFALAARPGFAGAAEAAPPAQPPAASSPKLTYNRDIRPILSNKCFKCHGPDAKERKADLRLDVAEEARKAAGSGATPIVPGKPDESELVARVFAEEDAVRMPPPDSHKTLSDAEQQTLKQWIAEGAEYQPHWSFIAPVRPELPTVADAAWARNGIDRFILARLDAAGLRQAPEADRPTLIRRLSFDLTGLPPTSAEIDAFLADSSGDAYERVVDRLMASPHYGERLALEWLDAARFADTNGYHLDNGRDMTHWREWVINSFNRNLPFDRFTIEQVAGDLLPEATIEQQIASGFNRNHMINFEGGAIPEEYQTAYVVDRVNTTGTVWLGLTIACGQCHDHKYDPITQKDYYRLYAFFNNIPENGLDGRTGNAPPLVKLATDEQKRKLAELAEAIEAAKAEAIRQALSAATGDRGSQQRGDLQKHYRETVSPRIKELTEKLAALKKSQEELDQAIPTTMVMKDMDQPRDTFMLVRGQYDQHGDKVVPGVPDSLSPLPAGAPANRLGLARWLVDPANPLVARVAVNRYWQLFFGTGLVKTAEDFGSQGELPSHPELLDWLAVEFMHPSPAPVGSGSTAAWDVKALVRLIVTSATYRQSSVVRPELLAKDPENRLLARSPRSRLHAEFIRDAALSMSGLLNDSVGGASVSPYQPPGLWEELASREDGKNWTAQSYTQSHGPDLYRRTMYTFWKRTSPPPTLITFDAPDRETCTVRRSTTNTPLQALVLLNDPTYVEAARKLAERIMTEAPADTDARIAFAFRLATARKPTERETAVLRQALDDQLAKYRADGDAARKLLSVGESPRNEQLDTAELAAWATVASMILNLDETVTKG
ncbi:MAG: PSD1 domain-containing protein [Planctomycetia bacterium]|nr:PSD1 domain-containing protein [Planctomycetia bacterium]